MLRKEGQFGIGAGWTPRLQRSRSSIAPALQIDSLVPIPARTAGFGETCHGK